LRARPAARKLREPQPSQTNQLLAEVERAFGPAYRFRIEMRGELPLAPSGKYQYLVPLPRTNR